MAKTHEEPAKPFVVARAAADSEHPVKDVKEFRDAKEVRESQIGTGPNLYAVTGQISGPSDVTRQVRAKDEKEAVETFKADVGVWLWPNEPVAVAVPVEK